MMKINFARKKQNDPKRDREMKVAYAPAKRTIAIFRWYFILLLVTSPLIYFLGRMIFLLLVVNAPGFISLEKIDINSSITGVVDHLVVKPGDIVNIGDQIIVLKDPRFDEREKILRAELKALDSPLPPIGSGLAILLHNRIVLAEEMVNYQADKLEEMRNLFTHGAATRAEINLAEADYIKAKHIYNVAKSQLAERLEHVQRTNLKSVIHVDLRTKIIYAELAAINEQREKLIHRSTVHGRVLDVFVQEGMMIPPGTNMMLIGEFDNTVIISYLQPEYTKFSRTGQKASIKLPDGTKFTAKVIREPGLAKRLPADLASPIGSRELMIIVHLKPVETIPSMFMIDGLPVFVRYHTSGFFSPWRSK